MKRLLPLLAWSWLALAVPVGAAAQDGNEDILSAEPLPLGVLESEIEAGPLDQQDWFSIEVEPGTLYLAIACFSDSARLSVRPCNAVGQVTNLRLHRWAPGASPQPGCSGSGVEWCNLQQDDPGRLFHFVLERPVLLQVESTNDLETVYYTLTAEQEISLAGDDANEENDTISTAAPAPCFSGGIGCDGIDRTRARFEGQVGLDDDFFALDVLAGHLRLGLDFDPEVGNLNLEVYDADFVRRHTCGDVDSGPTCSVWQPCPAGGTCERLIDVSILRPSQCAGGTAAGNLCASPGECPGGQCAPQPDASFDISRPQRLYVAVTHRKARVLGELPIPYQLQLDLPTQWITRLDPTVLPPDGAGPIRFGSITLADVDEDGTEEILVPTAKRLSDPDLDEVSPARLVCLNGDGSVRWSTSFPAVAGVDPFSGRTYQTTSVSSTPAVGDIDGDGALEVVVGVGADLGGDAEHIANAGDGEVPGQPGDRGGVYALDAATGEIEWFHESGDRIGGPFAGCVGTDPPPEDHETDCRPDGVFSTPLIADLDGGNPEVIFGGWDQHLWVLDGSSQTQASATCMGRLFPRVKWCGDVLDTIFSTPGLSDLDANGSSDILVGADITENPTAGTQTGGVFHVFDPTGAQVIPGFDQRINDAPGAEPIPGKFETQTLWSSPQVGDLDADGRPEVAYGTSIRLPGEGHFVRVWNHDGSEHLFLDTEGQTFASVLLADLDGDGTVELVAADSVEGALREGKIYAWTAHGACFWSQPGVDADCGVRTEPWNAAASTDTGILSSPLAVDLNGDDRLELLYAQGFSIVVVDADGNQLSDPTKPYLAMGGGFRGSPAVGDVDRDGILDIVAGGNLEEPTYGVVFSWRWELPSTPGGRFVRRQFVPEPSRGIPLLAVLGVAALACRRGALAERPIA